MADVAAERLYPTPFATSPLLPLLLMSLASQRHTPITKKEFKEEYDFIIVGAGGAGAVLASRLSEVEHIDVLLLEAGDDPPLLTEVPVSIRTFANTDVDWQFMTVPQKYTAAGHVNRQSRFPAGKMVGGSSVLNGRLSNRGNRKNYDDWAAMGAEGWSYKEVFPYFIRMEDNADPDIAFDGYHGIKGPMTMSRDRYHTILRDAVRKATTNLGYKVVDSDGPQQTGYTLQQFTMRDGQTCSTAKAYLVPSENRTNLDIVKRMRVTKVLIQNKRAIGVQFDDDKRQSHTVRARREVILSAGAINTPKLLMLSGIGPFEELQKLSIPIIADLPVGKNLQDHIGTTILYDISSIMQQPFEEQVISEENIRAYINNRTGPLTEPEGCHASSYLNRKDSPNDFQDFVLYTLFTNSVVLVGQSLWDPVLYEQLTGPYKGRASVGCVVMVSPKSRGFVSLTSSDPYAQPLIDPNYLQRPEDVENVVEGLKACRRIFDSPPLQKLGVKPFQTTYRGCENFTANEDMYFRCIVRTVVIPYYHVVGTARMGNPFDPSTVVDPQLRVKNIKGLRVVDASVMPSITWGNTLVTVIMIAEKAADMIKSTLRHG